MPALTASKSSSISLEGALVSRETTTMQMDENTNAGALYKKLGYKEIAVVPTVFNGIKGVNLVLLEKKV